MKNQTGQKLHIRKVTEADAELLFSWANDIDVRRNAFTQREIVWDEHVQWLKKKLADENCLMYIAYLYMTDMSENFDYTIIKTSTKENTGIDKFEQVIKDKFFHGEIAVNKEIYITNQRHKEALQEAFQSLELVLASIENQMPEDFYSIDLMDAYSALGRIIGEEVGDDLVNEIFGKFCMGK